MTKNEIHPGIIAEHERRSIEMFGKTLDEVTDINIYWMRENGYDGCKLRTTEERRKNRERRKRLEANQEKRDITRWSM